ncbi:MAG: ATP-binding cassette domain-containing protein, partial [Bacteroidaceae bacterium]|nr:ATP-binding cassette domain-containing protein [Bacteroidaceae bacterium]
MESYLQIDGLRKSFGDHVIFDDFSLNIAEGEKVGLIARNGVGKSTLLDIISGKEDYAAGSIIFRKDIKVSYLIQTPVFQKGARVIDTIPKTDEHDSWDHETRSKQILTKLGITEFEKPVDQLSGGQAKRVAL